MLIQSSRCDGLSGCASLCPPGPHRGDPDLTEASCQNLRVCLNTRWFCASSPFYILTLAAPSSMFIMEFSGLTKAWHCRQHTSRPTHRASLCSPNMSPTFSPLLFYFCSAMCSACKPLSIPFHLANSYHPSWPRKTLSPTYIPKECILPTAPQTHLCTSLIPCPVSIHIHTCSLATCGLLSGRDLVLFIWLFPVPSP